MFHCLPLKLKKTSELLVRLKKDAAKADLFEIWLDQIQDLKLDLIFQHKKKPLIFVNKPLREQGNFKKSEKERIRILEEALEKGADYIDLGIDTPKELLKSLVRKKKKTKTKLIISYHNFQKTPSLAELKKIVKKEFELGADIAKVATRVKNFADNFILLNLLKELRRKRKKIIVMGMGDLGKITRIMAPLLGSYLFYAPLTDQEKTASGQLTIGELKKIWREISIPFPSVP